MDAAARAAGLRLMIFDVDGVLTDGRLYFGPQGEALKVFDVRDGLGLKRLAEAGVTTAILSARDSPIVAARARELGIAHVLQGRHDKRTGLTELLAATGVTAGRAGFMGDDLPDLPVLQAVGFAATVPEAVPEVQAVAHWTAQAGGGRGAVRELAEFVLRARARHTEPANA